MADKNSYFHMTMNGGGMLPIFDTPTLTVAGAHHADDYVGTSGVAGTFVNCARVEGGGGWITGAVVLDGDKQSVAGELWVFDSDPTPPADNAAWTITDADLLRLICVIPVSTYYASGANSVGQSDVVSRGFKCASGSRNLRYCFVTRGAPSYTDQKFTVGIMVIQA